MDENTRFSNFMKTKFHKIPKYIRIKILKKVKFEPEIYFEKNSCLEIESNDIELYYINGKTKYNKIDCLCLKELLNSYFRIYIYGFNIYCFVYCFVW